MVIYRRTTCLMGSVPMESVGCRDGVEVDGYVVGRQKSMEYSG